MSLLTPNIIVDFELENELFFLRIANHSDVELLNISIRFNRIIYGLNKTIKLNNLHIFKNLKYLAPRKEIRIVIDHQDRFFHFNKKPIYLIRIDYKNTSGKSFRKNISHDLNIYRDLPQIFHPNSSRNSILDSNM